MVEIMNWEIVIGIETHAQVISQSKLFSTSRNNFGDEANENVNMLDAALPGQLPVLNEFCVKQAIKTALGINATVSKVSIFDRKHYFYPDLPPGYQITQFYQPIARNGYILIEDSNGKEKKINISSMHLEQDAGKLIIKDSKTLLDLNRAGCALMEIVSAPDMRSIDEAVSYVEKLRNILVYLGTCDGNMQEGSFRTDVNVSIRKQGEEKFGTRCEIKNLNSIRFMRKAIKYEVERQINLLEEGNEVIQQTMLFDEATGETKPMRSKADAVDYMYFNDPDLPNLIVSQEEIDLINSTIPELPDEKKSRFIMEYNLTSQDSSILTKEKEVADFFEKKTI
ncbi:aspartyl/glutamyl-tRNA(Asn/Gln) amidotransferase subunit B-like [Triplophysa rosa]|uniref:aspartyl/glutamyl-tRNA(Asn/Gln) amidotransferase subunit B-like n=1 Tax=Triplophysa rosa TaxID=992332 RepID=UPI0025460218|nr:aspartyl/glutamyl-tRNA(Asn/Gln) amidotransferase subunit B-like [Triplophysa rosa]